MIAFFFVAYLAGSAFLALSAYRFRRGYHDQQPANQELLDELDRRANETAVVNEALEHIRLSAHNLWAAGQFDVPVAYEIIAEIEACSRYQPGDFAA